jgi:hypothetical protein
MTRRRLVFILLLIAALTALAAIPPKPQYWGLGGIPSTLKVGRNVNMVSGTDPVFGDPYLQRQNEPSIAVSTMNSMHLLAGANDYRTVDYPISEGELPGESPTAAAGDAWLGVFESYDGGQTWKSTLLPGYEDYDTTPPGAPVSPLIGYKAAADPTVRAGANGYFFYSGIVFDRIVNGKSAIFVARFIDDNNKETGDTIRYIDTKLIDTGTSGQFADKPWLGVDQPVSSYGMGQLSSQSLSCGNVYIVYSVFVGDDVNNVHNKIMFARSTDCGETWGHPIKLSESNRVNQGTILAIDPANGDIYVAWRRFQGGTDPDAIIYVKSTDFGNKFTKPKELPVTIYPFDQWTSEYTFRTSAFPAIAAYDGNVYIAWSDRLIPGGDARIVMMASTNGGNSWSYGPAPIDPNGAFGHQFMPALTYSAGKLMAAWFDQRHDITQLYGGPSIADSANPHRHTIDVRAAQGDPGPPPIFEDSIRVSRYLWKAVSSENNQFLYFEPIQFNFPNFPLFKGGTVPFIGDYIDLAPSPRFIFDGGAWRFNGAPSQFSGWGSLQTNPDMIPLFHVAWTDNRDVNPPYGNPLTFGLPWTFYTPIDSSDPNYQGCSPDLMGMRNQNVYTALVGQGLVVGSYGNTKPLNIERTFVVVLKNTTSVDRTFDLTLMSNVTASFVPLDLELRTTMEVPIAAHSSISVPVYTDAVGEDNYEPIRINIEEQEGGDGLNSYIVLNPTPLSMPFEPPDGNIEAEYHQPNIRNVSVVNWAYDFPEDQQADTGIPVGENYTNYDPSKIEAMNPDVVNPNSIDTTISPEKDIANPNIRNPNIRNAPPDLLTDVEWTVQNTGNTTSSYDFKLLSAFVSGEEPEFVIEGYDAQLMIYRIHKSPVDVSESGHCALEEEDHHELIVNIIDPNFVNPYKDPNIRNPNIRNPNIRNPNIRNATFFLPPGEEALVLLRVWRDETEVQGASISSGTAPFDPEAVGAIVVSHASKADDEILDETLVITTTALDDAVVGLLYMQTLEVFGGSGNYEWDLENLGDFPPDLNLSSSGAISGTPLSAGNYTFTVRVTDTGNPSNTDTQVLSIRIAAELLIDKTEPLPPATINVPYTASLVAAGGIAPYAWSLMSGPSGLTLDPSGVIDWTPDSVGDFSIDLMVADSANPNQNAYDSLSITVNPPPVVTISGTVTHAGEPLEGIVLNIDGLESNPTTDENGFYTAIVDYGWSGTVTPTSDGYTFFPFERSYSNLVTNQLGQDFTSMSVEWVARYNNVDVNGDDEATAIVTDHQGNAVYVTGYSTGKTTGKDYATLKYNGSGNQIWETRYDGPSHEGDIANAICLIPELGYISLTGESIRGQPTKHSDILSALYDPSGNEIWEVRYDGRRNGNDVATAIATIGSQYVVVAGRSEESSEKILHFDFYTVKYNVSTGKQEWDARYNSEIDGNDEARAIAVDDLGNVYVTGKGAGDETRNVCVTVKYDTDGNELWVKEFPEGSVAGDYEAYAIDVDDLGNVYVTGRGTGTGTGSDIITVKYDTDGNVQWNQRYNNTAVIGDDEAYAIGIDDLSNVYVAGRSAGYGTGNDYVTVKYDTDGNELWVQKYNNASVNGDDEASALAIDLSGHVIVTGKSVGSGSNYDYFTIKYNGEGEILWYSRYNGTGNGVDAAVAIAVDDSGSVYVTGSSEGRSDAIDTAKDYVTIKYK